MDLTVSEHGSKSSDYFGVIVNAADGSILRRQNKVLNQTYSYRAFAQSEAPYTPYDSPYGNDLTPHPTGVWDDVVTETPAPTNLITIKNSGLISTDDPWLPEGATSTMGNHVEAYADLYAPDGYTEAGTDDDGNPTPGDVRPALTGENAFDYEYTHADPVNTAENMNSAVVNLFYSINHLHDTYYDHGFNEAAGNAQNDNYGRGGFDGDAMRAEGQDGEDTNNANMLTPPDGFSPRMQMYLWVHNNIFAQSFTMGDLTDVPFRNGEWSSNEFAVEGEMVRMMDGGDDDKDGCETPTNADALAGKIALVQRGNCNFTVKADNAQAAGAIAVVVANNDPESDQPVGMAGDPADTRTIPAVGVSYQSGVAFDEQIAAGNSANRHCLSCRTGCAR